MNIDESLINEKGMYQLKLKINYVAKLFSVFNERIK